MFVTAASIVSGTSGDGTPHVWADYWVEAMSNREGIDQVRFTWRFDTMFSAMLRNDLKIEN